MDKGTLVIKTPIISIKNISYSYPGSSSYILDNFSLDIYPKDYIALTGPNGVGKSTLVKIIAGLKVANSGTITAPKVALVFQSPRDQTICCKVFRDTEFSLKYCKGVNISKDTYGFYVTKGTDNFINSEGVQSEDSVASVHSKNDISSAGNGAINNKSDKVSDKNDARGIKNCFYGVATNITNVVGNKNKADDVIIYNENNQYKAGGDLLNKRVAISEHLKYSIYNKNDEVSENDNAVNKNNDKYEACNDAIYNKNDKYGMGIDTLKNDGAGSIRDLQIKQNNKLNNRIDKKEMRYKIVSECLKATGVGDLAARSTMSLSLGQTQRVAISAILTLDAPVVIFDEATSALDEENRDIILSLMDTLNNNGKTIIHITHDKTAIARAKRVIKMGGDPYKTSGNKGALDIHNDSDFDKDLKSGCLNNNFTAAVRDIGRVALKAVDLSFFYGNKRIFFGVNLLLKIGTLTAVTGVSGAGKSTLLEVLARLRREESGKVFARADPILCLQDVDAALFETYVMDEVAYGAKNYGLTGDALLAAVKNALNDVGLPFDQFGGKLCSTLSGGQKKRLAIAAIIAIPCDVLLFDEPTSMLDDENRERILKLLRKLSKTRAVLFTTHNKSDIAAADLHYKMVGGELINCSNEFTQINAHKTNQNNADGFSNVLNKNTFNIKSGIKQDDPVQNNSNSAVSNNGNSRLQNNSLKNNFGGNEFNTENSAVQNIFLKNNFAGNSFNKDVAANLNASLKDSPLQNDFDINKSILESAALNSDLEGSEFNTDSKPKEGATQNNEFNKDKDACNDNTLKILPIKNGARLVAALGEFKGFDERSASPLPQLFMNTLAFFLLFIATLVTERFFISGALLLVCVFFAIIDGVRLKRVIKSLIFVIPILSIFFIFQIFIPASDKKLWSWWFLSITWSKIIFSMRVLLRTQAILTLVLGYQNSTNEDDIITFAKPFGRYAVVLTEIIFRFIPLLVDEAQSILKTQLIRGKKSGRLAAVFFAISLCVPLVVRTLKRANLLGDALTVRGFE